MNDPVTMRRQLVAELRRMRARRGMTQRQVGEALDWSPSKIIRLEKSSVGIGVTDLQALLRLYEVHDTTVVDSLTEMARGSKRLPFNEYRGEIPAETLRYYRYEATADIIRQFEPLLVPGLLQTEEYAHGLLEQFGLPPERIDRIWSARAERQEALDRDDPPEMFFILGEAVVRQLVGDVRVRQRQRERLVELNAHPKVSIQIIPFDTQAHIGMLGSFAYLGFDVQDDPDVLYAEGLLGDSVIRDDEEMTSRYLEHFFTLERIASPAGDLGEILAAL